MSAKDFDIKELAVVIGGVLAHGYAAGGDAVSITFNRELATLVTGADGEGARSKMNDDSAEIRIRLLQSSTFNETLSAYARTRQSFTLAIKDNNGTTIAVSETAWIKARPDINYGEEVSEREWVLETDRLEANIGGVS